ncbi:MAG TPA: hypothetical protein VH639_24040 [Bryobacteraceae bacterium]|jgi:hypothetical protein
MQQSLIAGAIADGNTHGRNRVFQVGLTMRTKADFLADESRRLLVDFLTVELETGFTFARLAKTQNGFPNPEPHAAKLKKNVREVVGTVKRFRGRLNDEARKQIDDGLSKLERIASEL